MNSMYLYLCAIFASLGGLLSGYDMGVISGAILYIENSFKITSELSGLLVGCASFGAVIGAVINGLIIDKIGRKNTLILCSLIFIRIKYNAYPAMVKRFPLLVSSCCPLTTQISSFDVRIGLKVSDS